MSLSIRSPKDFWSGIMFLCFGLAGVYIAREYAMGSAGRMGPAFFPTMLGWMLAAIGFATAVRAMIGHGQALEKVAFKELFLVLGSVLLFAFLLRGGGLAVAIPVLIMVSAYASHKFTWKESALLAFGSAAVSIMLFVKALGLPLPVLGTWFGV
ncbi:tripartite tricarboxylate transporter TctB family protein [Massilia soli]|uniref:Tripartite tricarboxylate transporter TctB family protein n=1 Tax=Massilia soli TaxID=2792854 RepID=A0ABS7ST99_9BURK|nr:tripartite tricarboxylate transporter TctB family protein [Massilia soli]MBZ2209178.1 tripartite tricarboxylate transporter TctB family protein [Massilia soli]